MPADAIRDWDLPPLRPGRPAPDPILERRAALAGLAARHRDDPAVPRRIETIGGVRCHVVGAPDASPSILYFHGGGYRLGDPATWLGFASGLAAKGGLRFILPDYRLAPERPFPAALHDAVSVYRALCDSAGRPPIVAGDSAGGGLAASLAVAARANGAPSPDALILLSPWLDLSLASSTFESHGARDALFSRESAGEAVELYLQGASAELDLASPLFADPAAFPPVQIFCGGDEVLIGDALAFVARLAGAGGDVEAHFVAGMQHVWPMIAPDLPASAALRDAMIRFARAKR